MSEKIALVLLAGGEGKRLKTKETKVLVPLLGRHLIDYPLEALQQFSQKNTLNSSLAAVVGEQKGLKNYLEDRGISCAIQPQPLGTADALRCFFAQHTSAKQTAYSLVICGDTPLIRETHLQKMWEMIRANSKLDAVVATFSAANPFGYGRIVPAKSGNSFSIVEEKDANEEIKKITQVNSGLYIFKTNFLLKHLQDVKNNNQAKEFYLTDIFQPENNVQTCLFSQESSFKGVNDLLQLEEVEHLLRLEKIQYLREQGVRFLDSSSTRIDWDVQIEAHTIIYPQVVLEGKTYLKKGVLVEAGCVIKNSTIAENSVIKAHSYIENSSIHQNCAIGPFAHLRPESEIGSGSKIGNFVEIKKAKLHEGVKVSHLSYVGDAEIGKESNIGCGFITCNYDGVSKHKTIIGEHTFVGSDTQVIAPITIGSHVYIASGSTINQDIPDQAFAIARAKQETKLDMAKRFLKAKKS